MRRLGLLLCSVAMGFFVFTALAVTTLPRDGETPPPPGEEEIGCVAPPEWFQKGGTKEASYTDDLNPKNDCDFYRFAWQTFLFVTDPDQGDTKPRFLNFATPDEVFGEATTPTFPKRRIKDELILSPRVLKPKGVRDIDTIFQAISDGVLVDQNGRSLYYALHMNDAFVTFLKKNSLTTPDGIANAPETLMFEPGCLEFKSSWRIVGKNEDTSTFITRMAKVPALTMKDSKVVIDPSKPPRDERVAMVGLHVVGVAKGHPEFIWATFEHIRNAPDLPVGLLNFDDHGMELTKSSATVAEDRWTFCPKGALAKDCNIVNKGTVHLVDEDKQTLAPITPIFRHYAFGGDNPRGVASLNASVHEKLSKGDLRKNYELIGAVWLDNPLDTQEQKGTFIEGHAFPDEVLAGATKLSSSTMESFTQNTTGQKNCFGCHNTDVVQVPNTTIILKGKRINVSHMILRAFGHGKQLEAAAKK